MDNALVIALVRAHMMSDLSYMSWVPSYVKVHWSHSREACAVERVGGHWRRKALCKRSLDSLACVCKQPELMQPEQHFPPLGRKRNR